MAYLVSPIGRLAFPGAQTKTGNLAAPRFSAFLFAVAALISASGGTHRMRGVMVAVAVLSPVESSSPPQLFEQQFPSTPMTELWQERLCNFHREGIRRDQFYTNLLFHGGYVRNAMVGLTLQIGLREVDRVRQTSWRSGTGKTGLKFPGSEIRVGAGRDRMRESIPGSDRPGRGNDGR
jgi:hypothetical protein